MGKFQSPLVGYNNNVRHKNRTFHIQTEDSGVNRPHIITHIFMDGGRILKSVKQSYAEHVGTDDMKTILRALMKEQHSAMFVALREGKFDDLVDGGVSTAAKKSPAAAISEPSVPATVSSEGLERVQREQLEASEALHARAPTMMEAEGSSPEVPPSSPPDTVNVVEEEDDDPPDTRRLIPDSQRTGPEPLQFDLAACELSSGTLSPSLVQSDLPPPHPNLFQKEPSTSGAYRALEGGTGPLGRPSERSLGARPSVRSAGARESGARSTDKHVGASLFADDLLSDKSLDEVIMSYLAEDLDSSSK